MSQQQSSPVWPPAKAEELPTHLLEKQRRDHTDHTITTDTGSDCNPKIPELSCNFFCGVHFITRQFWLPVNVFVDEAILIIEARDQRLTVSRVTLRFCH